MVSSSHESMHRFFQTETGLVSRAFHDLLDVDLPYTTDVSPLDTDLTEMTPLVRRVDTLLKLTTVKGDYLLAVEAQSKKDSDKPSSWAYYLAYLYAKYGLQPILLVICQDRSTAYWASQPISLGLPQAPSMVVQPYVLGPHNVPRIKDVEEAARDLPMAVFSAITHGKQPGVAVILDILAEALVAAPRAEAVVYAEFVESGLGDSPARQTWRSIMETKDPAFRTLFQEYRDEGRAEGFSAGETRTRAQDIIRILDRRGIGLTSSQRGRVSTCTDLAQLDIWFDRSLVADSAAELFAEPDEAAAPATDK